jgi:hypothetical protein
MQQNETTLGRREAYGVRPACWRFFNVSGVPQSGSKLPALHTLREGWDERFFWNDFRISAFGLRISDFNF